MVNNYGKLKQGFIKNTKWTSAAVIKFQFERVQLSIKVVPCYSSTVRISALCLKIHTLKNVAFNYDGPTLNVSVILVREYFDTGLLIS